MKSFDDENLFTDHIYPCTAISRSPLPLTPVLNQRSWRDCPTARIRYAMSQLCKDDTALIEGIHVQRTGNSKHATYIVNSHHDSAGNPVRVGFEAAVIAVCKQVQL